MVENLQDTATHQYTQPNLHLAADAELSGDECRRKRDDDFHQHTVRRLRGAHVKPAQRTVSEQQHAVVYLSFHPQILTGPTIREDMVRMSRLAHVLQLQTCPRLRKRAGTHRGEGYRSDRPLRGKESPPDRRLEF